MTQRPFLLLSLYLLVQPHVHGSFTTVPEPGRFVEEERPKTAVGERKRVTFDPSAVKEEKPPFPSPVLPKSRAGFEGKFDPMKRFLNAPPQAK